LLLAIDLRDSRSESFWCRERTDAPRPRRKERFLDAQRARSSFEPGRVENDSGFAYAAFAPLCE
jgi:hypothetical protein